MELDGLGRVQAAPTRLQVAAHIDLCPLPTNAAYDPGYPPSLARHRPWPTSAKSSAGFVPVKFPDAVGVPCSAVVVAGVGT